jgi:hypothetical protein
VEYVSGVCEWSMSSCVECIYICLHGRLHRRRCVCVCVCVSLVCVCVSLVCVCVCVCVYICKLI